MKATLLARQDGLRTYSLVFGTGEEVAAGILSFATGESVTGAFFTGIGGFRAVTLGFFEVDTREYRPIEIDEQVEVLALTGNIALTEDGGPRVHAHVVVGTADGSAHGGHFLSAVVRPTLEILVVEMPSHLCRYYDAAAGVPLLRSR